MSRIWMSVSKIMVVTLLSLPYDINISGFYLIFDVWSYFVDVRRPFVLSLDHTSCIYHDECIKEMSRID